MHYKRNSMLLRYDGGVYESDDIIKIRSIIMVERETQRNHHWT